MSIDRNWIAISEAMPEAGKDVFILLDHGLRTSVSKASWCHELGCWIDSITMTAHHLIVDNTVTHWMPVEDPRMTGTLTRNELALELRVLSSRMIHIGAAMDYFGGFSEIAQHGHEMMGAAMIAAQWADRMEEINSHA